MRLPAEVRVGAEWVLRVALVAGLALALVRSREGADLSVHPIAAEVRGLPAALRAATRNASVSGVEVAMDSTPDAVALDWLAALPRAGVPVRWRGGPPPLAVAVTRSPEPDARARIAVASADGASLALTDSAGALDSVRAGSRGATIEVPVVVGTLRAASGRFGAVAAVPAAASPRAVLVLGRAGWEARFVAEALQEAGWTVRSRQPAAPGVVVGDAGVLPVDTARYAAVVALDSTASALAPAVAQFVRQGGGLVLAGEATALPAFAPLAPARAGAREPGRVVLDADTITRGDLPSRALGDARADAVRLEGSAAAPALLVRRAGLGRVAAIAYEDTWRWRMLGGASGPAAHRAWWSRLVGSVALDGTSPSGGTRAAAPRAALVEALGPPSPAVASAAREPARDPLALALLAALVALLLAETASRRFRGAR